MTREQAIKMLKSKMDGHTDTSYEWAEAVRMAIKALSSSEKPNKWIPVSEMLPEIHQDVILSLRSLDIEIGFRAEKEPYFYCYDTDICYIELQDVLAWMPLLEPYIVESEE